MNKYFFALLLPFLQSCSANGQDISATYLYYSDSSYFVSVVNPKECGADIRINFTRGGLPVDTTVTVDPGTTSIVKLPADFDVATKIKFKSDGRCSTTGWAYVKMDNLSLPVHVTKFTARRTGDDVVISYDLTWTLGINETAYIERSKDGRRYFTVHSIPFGEHTYTDYLVHGFAYYRIRISSAPGADKLSNIIVVQDRDDSPDYYVLYSFSGSFVARVLKGSALPKGSFILADGVRSRKVLIN